MLGQTTCMHEMLFFRHPQLFIPNFRQINETSLEYHCWLDWIANQSAVLVFVLEWFKVQNVREFSHASLEKFWDGKLNFARFGFCFLLKNSINNEKRKSLSACKKRKFSTEICSVLLQKFPTQKSFYYFEGGGSVFLLLHSTPLASKHTFHTKKKNFSNNSHWIVRRVFNHKHLKCWRN